MPVWSGVRDALAFGPASPQSAVRVRPPGLQQVLGSGASLDAGHSEDCLVLNAWTPGVGDGAARPIMVWIHGGGY
jgi:para-nitrobenzyl esterase